MTAKLGAPLGTGGPDDATRTVAVNINDPGTTIGTIAYMSPEQGAGAAGRS